MLVGTQYVGFNSEVHGVQNQRCEPDTRLFIKVLHDNVVL